ncbi:hypothetical protein Bsp3421_000538 (plasmid) [Burkholderia sp. FERM BP-3421]|uniref:hypothetical protein n=1 Tax=Burkholderia sp. FERM BP-3421 TaxID=1494466 RepID=UPI00235F43F1|nr:hypothetical protein [Burkholderia sp. FERM BP-3421]WDD90674.1 hypothetical protein Bsp3421_000538 [Burkholderia sp. FERM BP-3421]
MRRRGCGAWVSGIHASRASQGRLDPGRIDVVRGVAVHGLGFRGGDPEVGRQQVAERADGQALLLDDPLQAIEREIALAARERLAGAQLLAAVVSADVLVREAAGFDLAQVRMGRFEVPRTERIVIQIVGCIGKAAFEIGKKILIRFAKCG